MDARKGFLFTMETKVSLNNICYLYLLHGSNHILPTSWHSTIWAKNVHYTIVYKLTVHNDNDALVSSFKG